MGSVSLAVTWDDHGGCEAEGWLRGVIEGMDVVVLLQ